MKILFVCPIKSEYIKKIHTNLLELNDKVVYLQYESGKNIFEKIGAAFKFITDIRKESKKDYDVINIHYPFIATLAFVFLNVQIPIVTTLHGSDAVYNEINIKKKIMRILLIPFLKHLLNISETVTVNTKVYKEHITKKYKISPLKIKVVPSVGYDQQYFYPSENTTQHKSLKVGFVGRLTEKKGWRNFIKAYKFLRKQTAYDVEFQLVGYGPDEEKIKQKISEINAEIGDEKLTFLGKRVDHQLGDFYRQLDLFIFPTQFFESLGLVGIESLACGIPVIGSDVGGVASYLEQGYNGFLTDPNDYKKIAEYVVEYIELDEIKKNKMHEHAIKSVTSYENKKVAAQLQNVLSQAKKAG